MGFLGIPNKAELIKRAVVGIIDNLNDQIDSEEEQVAFANYLADHLNIPLLDADEERAALLEGVKLLSKALEKLESVARNWKF